MKTIKTCSLVLLAVAGVSVASSTAFAETTYGFFPGIRWGYGKGTYRANETYVTDPANRGNGQQSWARLSEFRFSFIADFDEVFAVGADLGYLSSSISNPREGGYGDFAYGGWTIGAVGMLAILDYGFLSGRLGLVRGDVEAWQEENQGSTGLRAGASLNVPVVHNSIVTWTVGLGVDWLRSGSVRVFAEDTRFSSWAVVLDMTAAMHLD